MHAGWETVLSAIDLHAPGLPVISASYFQLLHTWHASQYKALQSHPSQGAIVFVQGIASSGEGIRAPRTPRLEILRELIGNQGEITDLRFIGSPSKPSHLAVATNSSIIRLYNLASKACEAAIHGHTDMVLALDSIQAAQGHSILASGSKDCSFRLWNLQARLLS